jgi:H+-translocating NAD(P) transhydrogenase subunit alpha
MKIFVPKETAQHEKRVALTPETIKKLADFKVSVILEKDAGKEAGIPDALFEAAGAKITQDKEAALKEADLLIQVAPPNEEDITKLQTNAVVLAMMKPYTHGKLIKHLAKSNITSIALELIPRISRAQAMDVLSSQSNLAGYKAVVDSSAEFGRAMPMMMTAAGTIPPAKVLILGAGVAGLQAIATARRLGAVVSVFDVRAAAKEQVESLGAQFVEVEYTETGEGSGGYAKEMSEEYKKRQAEKLAEVIKTQDIIITTALIPGKPAPVLITEAMVKSMKPGSIIYDLAVENGGNCELAEFGKTLIKHGVKIIGHANVPSRIPFDASQVYSRNIFNFLKAFMDSEQGKLNLNFEDEILKGATLTHDGKVVHPTFQS